MKWLVVCLLFTNHICSANSLSINDWLSYFSNNNINIIHSSDYLSTETGEQFIDLNAETVESFSQGLESFSLTLVKIDDHTYVINPIASKHQPVTGLIIHASDHNNNPLESFYVVYQDKRFNTNNGVVLLNELSTDNVHLSLGASDYITVSLDTDTDMGTYKSITVLIEAAPVRIDKLIVTASRFDFQNLQSSKNTFSRKDIENTISFSNDPIRATERVAGNTSTGLSGKFNTRGGHINESLIVLDNNVLRNPFHFKNFFSLFSTINLSVVDGLDFYSGIFPIKYGDRLSSVLAIQTGDNLGKETHEIGADLLNVYYTYRRNNSDFSKQFMASIRTGGQLINDKLIEDSIIQPEFDDAYFKLSQQINNNWQASQHLLVSRDEISINDVNDEDTGEVAEAGYHDQDLWLQWNFDNHRNATANILVYASRKHNNRSGNVLTDSSQASLAEDTLTKYSGIKFTQTINYRDNLSFNFGANLFNEDTVISSTRNIYHFGPLVEQLGLQRQELNQFELDRSGNGIDSHFNSRYKLTKKIVFDLGFRYEYKQWIKEAIASPRFNLSYFYNDSTTLRFAIGRHQQSQYLDELLLEDENPEYFEPSSADIAVFEINKELTKHLNLRAEIYYKKYSSTQPYYENLFSGLQVLPDLFFDRVRVTPDDSEARGAELTISSNHEEVNWSLSYIFSDVDDEIGDVEVPRSWDQHNALKFNLHVPFDLKYFHNWQLDFSANYHTGWAKTELIQNGDSFQVGVRNKDNFPDFYQVD
ncbi:MAG TPA: hypothetical protein ENJ41_06300, partial [Oceanospirillales bacterium]|nr:hypothetical protein [Oceanospirillales bacterium]